MMRIPRWTSPLSSQEGEVKEVACFMDENNPYNRLGSEDPMMEIEERREDPVLYNAHSSQQRVHPDVVVRRPLMPSPPRRENKILWRFRRCPFQP